MKLITRISLIALLLCEVNCFDVHDNPVTVDLELCEAIQEIKSSKSEEEGDNDSELLKEWESCTFNEECETNLCMCETCIDFSRFVKFQ